MKYLNIIKELIFDKILLIILIILGICAIIFGFYDLQISNAMVNETSQLAEFGRDYGELPGYGLIAVSILILSGGYFKTVKVQKKIGIIGISVGVAVLCWGYLDGRFPLILIGGTIAVSIGIFLLLTRDVLWAVYNKLAISVISLALIVPLMFVQSVKVLSGRVRYYDLLPDHSNYTPWFEFHGIDFQNSSFPSGHTAMAWMLLPLMVFLWNNEYSLYKKRIGTILIVSWGIFVLLSRVVIGAHYASDVLFSTGMAIITTYLLYKISNIKPQ
jgi:membrane-associated phospholipid phosphatase